MPSVQTIMHDYSEDIAPAHKRHVMIATHVQEPFK